MRWQLSKSASRRNCTVRINTNGGAESVNLTSNLKYGEANTVKLKRVSGKFGIYDETII